tara:strand:- start:38 stop:151 length:114 start_codon:yes stop_codon:yes gene_type:complete
MEGLEAALLRGMKVAVMAQVAAPAQEMPEAVFLTTWR